jgi:hypothetical protein
LSFLSELEMTRTGFPRIAGFSGQNLIRELEMDVN